jgi:hypothetical protein
MSRTVRLIVLVLAAAGLALPAAVANAAAPPQITTSSLPSVIQGTKYPTTPLKVTGGSWPYKWSIVAGALPYGLKLTSGGQITGATAYPYGDTDPITFQVKDAKGATATRALTIHVTPWTITTTSLKNAKRGWPYSAQLKINGKCLAYPASHIYSQSMDWFIATSRSYPGTLPEGLKISSPVGASYGTISGTPKVAGTYTFVVGARCQLFNNGSDSQVLTLTVT